MAEAIARYDAADVIVPSSAGLGPLGFIPEQTRQTLQLNGYSWKGLSSKRLTIEAIDGADLIINMSGSPRETDPGVCSRSSTPPRPSTQPRRVRARPLVTSMAIDGSVYGPVVS